MHGQMGHVGRCGVHGCHSNFRFVTGSTYCRAETEQLAETVQDRERISVSRAKAAERKSWVIIPRKSVIVPDAYWNQDTTYRLISWETAT